MFGVYVCVIWSEVLSELVVLATVCSFDVWCVRVWEGFCMLVCMCVGVVLYVGVYVCGRDFVSRS